MKKASLFAGLLLAAVLAAAAPAPAFGDVPDMAVASLAGTGGHGAQDGPAAQFNMPAAVFPGRGGLIVVDTYNNMLRVIDGAGETARLAGDIVTLDENRFPLGFLRDGPLSQALFNRPMGGAVNRAGHIIVADAGNHAIRIIRGENVYTWAGGMGAGHADGRLSNALFNFPAAVAFDRAGNLFVADTLNHVIRRIGTNGQVTTVAGTPGVYGFADGPGAQALFNGPMGIAVGADGTVFVADTGNHLIRAIRGGRVSTLAGTLRFPADINEEGWDAADWDNEPVGGFADGAAALFDLPRGLAVWGDMLVVADSANHRVRGVLPGGQVITLAGAGEPGFADGPSQEAYFHFPAGVFASGDTLYIVDTGNNIIRILAVVPDEEEANPDE